MKWQSSISTTVVIAFTGCLSTSLQTVRRQFDSEAFKMLPPKEFKFQGSDEDAKLTLEFSRNVDGWTIARECFNEKVWS